MDLNPDNWTPDEKAYIKSLEMPEYPKIKSLERQWARMSMTLIYMKEIGHKHTKEELIAIAASGIKDDQTDERDPK